MVEVDVGEIGLEEGRVTIAAGFRGGDVIDGLANDKVVVVAGRTGLVHGHMVEDGSGEAEGRVAVAAIGIRGHWDMILGLRRGHAARAVIEQIGSAPAATDGNP